MVAHSYSNTIWSRSIFRHKCRICSFAVRIQGTRPEQNNLARKPLADVRNHSPQLWVNRCYPLITGTKWFELRFNPCPDKSAFLVSTAPLVFFQCSERKCSIYNLGTEKPWAPPFFQLTVMFWQRKCSAAEFQLNWRLWSHHVFCTSFVMPELNFDEKFAFNFFRYCWQQLSNILQCSGHFLVFLHNCDSSNLWCKFNGLPDCGHPTTTIRDAGWTGWSASFQDWYHWRYSLVRWIESKRHVLAVQFILSPTRSVTKRQKKQTLRICTGAHFRRNQIWGDPWRKCVWEVSERQCREA